MSVDSSHSFGTLLRRYRMLAGLTQESLAEHAGISTRAVSDLERGINRAPRADTLEMLANALSLAQQDRATLIAAAHPDLDAGPPSASETAGRVRLPLPPTPLIGREADLLRGLRLLQSDGTRLLTVAGPGGVGKTHLALELARQSAGRFTGGAVFVDLAAISDVALVPAALAQALGLREPPTGTLFDALKDALQGQNILLLLDNVEQVSAGAPMLAELLAACPRLSLLTTSRTPLHLRAEQVLMIAPLSLPDAATLFYARAAALRDDLALAPAEVTALCEQVDCLPLAIELCAAQLGALSLSDLHQRLSAGVDLPRAGAQDLPARHQALRHAIGWSYDLLPATAQALFRRMAVFAGGCTLAAIQAVCVPESDPARDMLPDVIALVDASLLRMRHGADGTARYEMLATIQDYARERLSQAGELDEYAQHHAEYLAGLEGDEVSLARELPNVRAALTWARNMGRNALGMALLARFGRIWYLSGLLSEMRGWLETFLELDAASETPAPLAIRANVLFGAARLAYDRGEPEVAATYAEQALQTARQVDDYESMSHALTMLGQIAQGQGEMERASALFDESLVCARKSGVRHALSAALGFRAQVAQDQGDLAHAVALLEEALDLARQMHSLWGEALTQTHLGLLAFAQQRYEQTRQHYTSALEHYRTFGSDIYLAWCLENVAALDEAEGNYTRAAKVSAGAEALRIKGHAPRPAGEQQAFERVQEACREALGEEVYQRLWSAGAATARDTLIRLALGEDDALSQP